MNPAGKLTLLDSRVRKAYSVNIHTGAESPLDIDFLRFSKSPIVQEYSDYIQSATIAGKMNSTGAIDFIIKLKVSFDGTDNAQAVVVFMATSTAATLDLSGYGYNQSQIKAIESTVKLDHIESPSGPSSATATAYQFALSLLAKLYPADGFHSSINNFEYWW